MDIFELTNYSTNSIIILFFKKSNNFFFELFFLRINKIVISYYKLSQCWNKCKELWYPDRIFCEYEKWLKKK